MYIPKGHISIFKKNMHKIIPLPGLDTNRNIDGQGTQNHSNGKREKNEAGDGTKR